MLGKNLFFVNCNVIPLKILNVTDADRFPSFHNKRGVAYSASSCGFNLCSKDMIMFDQCSSANKFSSVGCIYTSKEKFAILCFFLG